MPDKPSTTLIDWNVGVPLGDRSRVDGPRAGALARFAPSFALAVAACFALGGLPACRSALDRAGAREVTSATPARFPGDWLGHWSGPATIFSAAGERAFLMELVISPSDEPSRFSWTLIYDARPGTKRDPGAPPARQERPYALIINDAANGEFTIDEGNSIRLPARLLGGTLWSLFTIQGSRLTASYELRDRGTPSERLVVEIVSSQDGKNEISTGGEGGVPPVTGITPSSLQRAVMTRVK